MKQWKTTMIGRKKSTKSAFKHLLKRCVLPNFFNDDHYIKECQLLKKIALYSRVMNII